MGGALKVRMAPGLLGGLRGSLRGGLRGTHRGGLRGKAGRVYLPPMKKSTPVSGASLRHAFREIIWPRRKLVALGLLLILINRLAQMVLPASTKYLVDEVIAEGNFDLLIRLLILVGLAVAVQAASSFGLTVLLSVEAQHLIAQLRSQVQRHVLQLPVRLFDSTKSGELVSRIMNDVEGVRNLVGTGLRLGPLNLEVE